MRSFSHYLIICLFVALGVGAYAAVALSALCYWGILTPAVAVALISAGVAVVTGLIALVKDAFAAVINAPQLTIRFFPYDKRDCHATAFRDSHTGALIAKTHYFRVRVENRGWRTSEDVEVTLEEVQRFQNGKFVIDTDFMPIRLFWSHWRDSRYEIPIPTGAYRHCDLGFIIEPTARGSGLPAQENNKLLFWFDVFLRPNTGRTSLLPGRYRITLSAFGKNVKRSSLTLELEWMGLWHDDIDTMFRDSFLPKKGFEAAQQIAQAGRGKRPPPP